VPEGVASVVGEGVKLCLGEVLPLPHALMLPEGKGDGDWLALGVGEGERVEYPPVAVAQGVGVGERVPVAHTVGLAVAGAVALEQGELLGVRSDVGVELLPREGVARPVKVELSVGV